MKIFQNYSGLQWCKLVSIMSALTVASGHVLVTIQAGHDPILPVVLRYEELVYIVFGDEYKLLETDEV